jgi:uncharacterized protein YdeI (YjbR/CyaY-like superfamily)
MKTLIVKDREEWRAWLAANHDREKEVWLTYFKKGSGLPSIAYGDSLDEALCFGWIDSLIKRIDDIKYVRKFTPRKDDSKWSLVNKQRVQGLIKAGLMTEHGLKKVEAAKLSGSWENPIQKPKLDFEMPTEFASELQQNPRAQETFNKLAPTYQKQYLGWISTAKRPETKQKRIAESILLLSEGKKLGLR